MITESVSRRGAVPLRRLFLILLTAAFLLPITAPDAEAQILNRIKKRAQEAAERRAEQAAERAVNSAADKVEGRAAEAAGNAIGNAVGNAAGLPAGSMSGGGSMEGMADFRVLQELLPESFAGLSRTDSRGEASGTMGIKVSSAKGSYEGGNRSVSLSITDTGTMRAFLAMSAAWVGMNMDQETSTGFTRTTTIAGMPAYVQEDRDGGLTSNVQVVVGDRFLISADGQNLSAADLQSAVGRLDFGRLQAMADELAAQGPQLVPFDQLIPLLPSSAAGFTRQNPTGETGGVAGIESSQAAVAFTRGDENVTVHITDLGSLSGVAAISHAAWLSVPVNRQTTEGFERTTRYGSHPAFEKESNSEGYVNSEVQIAVGRRFLVSVEGNVPFDTVKGVAQSVNLDALARLAEAQGDN